MELLSSLSTHKNYCDTIKKCSFTQRTQEYPTNTVYHTINDLFIDRFDPTCQILENKDKYVYRKQRIVEIATALDENKEESYSKFSYSKQMKSSFIQIGLQTPNTLSSLLYLSDLYKVTSIIYIDSLKTKVITSKKNRDYLHILFKDGSYMELDEPIESNEGEFKDLEECFILNVKSFDVYNTYLDSISKYKSPELLDIATSIGLPLEKNGKKKVKKQIYDDINLYYLNKTV